ncbi:hypothetical protein [Bacillus sp. NPDC060175]|uniref:hypothetical protein n=1 Tax=Bacillus sp. NPDC060175 TaxID=3347061 RepID=UPI003655C474
MITEKEQEFCNCEKIVVFSLNQGNGVIGIIVATVIRELKILIVVTMSQQQKIFKGENKL